MQYPHLNFKSWPFQIVPDENFVKIWADRKEVLDDVYSILQSLTRREPSSINLIWAWFGAGKSHTLKHMAYLCRQKHQDKLFAVYTEYPRTARSFLDLYNYFAAEIPSELKSKKKPKNSDEAIRLFTEIVSKMPGRLIWMIDEFQRISTERKTAAEDINAGLHSIFNANPNNFSLFLSFSVKEKQAMFKLLSKELVDRVGIQKIIEIPPMSENGALTFISDLLYEFRLDKENLPAPYFPFEEDTVRYIIFLIQKNSELKPRSIMQYFSAVLERAEPLIASGDIKTIEVAYAKSILESYDLFLSFQKESLISA